jgi:hypothetical protein
MTTRKFNRKNSKSQKAGKRIKKITSKRKGGILNTIATAIIPFGLVAAKRSYSKSIKRNKSKARNSMKKKLRKLKLRR